MVPLCTLGHPEISSWHLCNRGLAGQAWWGPSSPGKGCLTTLYPHAGFLPSVKEIGLWVGQTSCDMYIETKMNLQEKTQRKGRQVGIFLFLGVAESALKSVYAKWCKITNYSMTVKEVNRLWKRELASGIWELNPRQVHRCCYSHIYNY